MRIWDLIDYNNYKNLYMHRMNLLYYVLHYNVLCIH